MKLNSPLLIISSKSLPSAFNLLFNEDENITCLKKLSDAVFKKLTFVPNLAKLDSPPVVEAKSAASLNSLRAVSGILFSNSIRVTLAS